MPSQTKPNSHTLNGQETEHVKIEHMKLTEHTFAYIFREDCQSCRGHYGEDPVVLLTPKASTFVGIFVDIFVYTPVCIFARIFVREFGGQILRAFPF